MNQDPQTGLYLPINHIRENDEFSTRGFGEKVSLTDPYRSRINDIIDYEPTDEDTIVTNTSLKKLLRDTKPSSLIPKLIRCFPIFSFALNIYRQNINQGWDFDCEDTRTLDVAYEIRDDLEAAGRSLDVIIEEQIYCLKAEGAVSFELVFDDNDKLVDMSYVSPHTLTFRIPPEDELGRYKILQKGLAGSAAEDRDLYIPTDDRYTDENRFFFYRGVNTQKGKPRGVSIFVSALRSALSAMEVDNMFVEFLRGQAFPKGFLSPKVAELVSAGFTREKLTQTIENAVDSVKKQLDNGEKGESVVSSVGFEFVLLGALSRARLDGATIATDSIDYKIQAALDIPDSMLPSRKSGVLGEQSGRTQWTRWQNTLRADRKILSSMIEPSIQVALVQKGMTYNRHKVHLVWDQTDTESRLHEAQAFKEEMQGFKVAIDEGIMDAAEARRIIIAENSRFKDLDPNKEITLPANQSDQAN